MSVLPIGIGDSGGYEITNSVRLRASASAYFNRTFGAPTSQQKKTFSFWVKRSKLDANNICFETALVGGSHYEGIYLSGGNLFGWTDGAAVDVHTAAVIRDPSAWYHFLVSEDTTQATAANRIVLYINGVAATLAGGATYPAQNTNTDWGTNALTHYIGRDYTGASNLDGYLSDVYFIDGQALTPSSFGQTDSNGVWVPKAYTGTYGTNGFKLDFKDAALTVASNVGLGKDVSGNGNYWVTNNISVTAGVTYDSMVDTPTNNYATLNPVDPTTGTIDYAALRFTSGSAAFRGMRTTIAIPSTGKWYYEATVLTTTSGAVACALGLATTAATVAGSAPVGVWAGYADASGNYWTNGSATAGPAGVFTAGNTIQIAGDSDNSRIWFGKNNSWWDASSGTTGNPGSNSNPTFSQSPSGLFPYVSCYSETLDLNFGQRPFTYTPPTGYKALCTANLPAVTITNPKKHFDAGTRTGTAANANVTGFLFQPDLVWGKSRNNAYSNWLYDKLRGTNRLISDSTAAESDQTTFGVASFNSDGFSLGSNTTENGSGSTAVHWLWKANGAGVSNTAGSITSTVSANQTAGFSIVTWTGNGTNTGTVSVGHGLGAVPAMVIIKERSNTNLDHAWIVRHKGNSTKGLILNSTAAEYTPAAGTNGDIDTIANASSTVFKFINGAGSASNYNTNGCTMVAYCFAEIPGFSKFGSYVGNGSSDGPFVHCGFRPKWVLIKRTDTISNWVVWDTTRDTYNAGGLGLYPNLTSAEDDYRVSNPDDILSNGFKPRANYANVNAAGGTYIFAAFAESPFGGSNISPSPAR